MRNCSLYVSGLIFLSLGISIPTLAQEEKNNKTETRIERKEIPFGVRYEFSRTVGRGRLVKAEHGEKGSVSRTFKIFFENGKPVRKELILEERTEPKPAVILMGKSGYQPSRHAFTRHKVMTMSATAYDPSPQTIGPGATGRTCTGMKATYGVVAVDPRVIKLGTLVYVEGYGFAIAADRGGAIKGNKIDLCFDKRSTANAFGRKKVRVHILRTPQ